MQSKAKPRPLKWFGCNIRQSTLKCLIQDKAVVRRDARGTLAPPEFGISEQRTEREIDSLLLKVS